ncbi:hypothetical protein [Aquimarina sp. RZ0]|uniref:hypothetical protein n=1 Tax=Aquimarina sp. RZ0 TaxID=2607730 RepID=UPI0011F244F7|nr:hypothetical protein [Aquimarina sp. RZ0]KAA1247097.1 hypothetical protein F0000_05275 [Aquimarina sp. RZ0]
MKHLKKTVLIFIILIAYQINAQESKNDNYIEFNDRKNIVHGVYLGFNLGTGEIDGEETGLVGLKLAYVANRQIEAGFAIKGFYSQQNLPGISASNNEDLVGGYTGFHVEPILFSKSRINLSFPLLIGAGFVGYIDGKFEETNEDFNEDDYDWDTIFVTEPGISLLFNISRYVQLEAGVKYRFSSKFSIHPNGINRINGFSADLGIKVGVFNLGRNRYKKNIPNE